MNTRIEADDNTAAGAEQWAAGEKNVAELDRRWERFEAQISATSNEDVLRWLRTWGTSAFRKWRDRECRD